LPRLQWPLPKQAFIVSLGFRNCCGTHQEAFKCLKRSPAALGTIAKAARLHPKPMDAAKKASNVPLQL
jgi:hypothetical protein